MERDVGPLDGVSIVRVRDAWAAVASAAARYYGHPARSLRVVGITGTSGKTSSTYFVDSVLAAGGETVAPLEVEQALASHPDIADVAVIGLPDAAWGEVVCAAVVVTRPVTLEQLREHCAGLATYKHPRRLLVVDAIPRTAATAQVQRSLLIELALSAVTAAQ